MTQNIECLYLFTIRSCVSLGQKIENQKKLLEAIKDGGKSWSELDGKLLPKKTLSRYLSDFKYLGIIYQDEERRYHWSGRKVLEKSPKFIEHSLKIIRDLERVPFVGVELSYGKSVVIQEEKQYEWHSFPKPRFVENKNEDAALRRATLEHLEKGYSKLFGYVMKLEKMQPKILNDLGKRGIEIGSDIDPDDPTVKSIIHDFFAIRKEFAGKVAELRAQLEYNPSRLKGSCYICGDD